MEKNNKEGLQSRREFFKNAAKGALPILAAVALANAPAIAKAAETSPSNCNLNSCSFTCSGSCSGSCGGSCGMGCSGGCRGGCGGCRGACQASCSGFLR